MPFGGKFEDYYREIYKPAIEQCGYKSRRSDDLFRPSTIIQDIWFLIQDATIILADLSERNPNVLYELGLAHAIQKPVILLSNNIEEVPFDLRSLRILIYETKDPNWSKVLSEKILST